MLVSLSLVAAFIYFAFGWVSERHSWYQFLAVGLFTLSLVPVYFSVLRMLLMRLPPPEGRELTRAEAPKLFDLLAKMRKKLKGPQIHHVLINTEYNAAISQLPRWGLFGGHTNYLMLGLPYLLGVPSKEMLATIAHEYGHLCGHHGKISAWIYRQRRTFGKLYEHVKNHTNDSWVHAMLASMLDRFMPYYNAYTFVLSRQNEYEATARWPRVQRKPVTSICSRMPMKRRLRHGGTR